MSFSFFFWPLFLVLFSLARHLFKDRGKKLFETCHGFFCPSVRLSPAPVSDGLFRLGRNEDEKLFQGARLRRRERKKYNSIFFLPRRLNSAFSDEDIFGRRGIFRSICRYAQAGQGVVLYIKWCEVQLLWLGLGLAPLGRSVRRSIARSVGPHDSALAYLLSRQRARPRPTEQRPTEGRTTRKPDEEGSYKKKLFLQW